jgi:hypothetical protein
MNLEFSDNIDQIAVALSAVTGAMSDPAKDATGYGYKYAQLDSYLRIVRPLLAANGLALMQTPSSSADLMTVSVTAVLMHSSGQWIRSSMTMRVEPKKGLSDAQCAGTVISYIRRYQVQSLFACASEDNDAARDRDRDERGRDDLAPRREDGLLTATLEVAQRQLDRASTLEELGNTWATLPANVRKALGAHKDKCKQRLQEASHAAA